MPDAPVAVEGDAATVVVPDDRSVVVPYTNEIASVTEALDGLTVPFRVAPLAVTPVAACVVADGVFASSVV